MRLINLVLVGLLSLLAASSALAQVTLSYNGTNAGPIPDGGGPGLAGGGNFGPPRDMLFDVSGRVGTVSAVSVALSADHPFVGDLRVTLIAPNGMPHILFSRTGSTTATGFGVPGNLVNGNTYDFDDASPTNWWTHVGTANVDIPSVIARTTMEGGAGVISPAPVTSLNEAFASTPPNGQWILRFEDGGAGDVGAATAALLRVTTTGMTRTVSNDADSGAGSLRATLTAAQEGDLITFASSFFDVPRSINLLTALPVINRSMAIQGPGAHLLTVRRADGAGNLNLFDIISAGSGVSLSGMQLSNGRTPSEFGGGIFCDSPLVLSGIHLVANRSAAGGGLAISRARATIINSTISGNQTASTSTTTGGGGIYFSAAAPDRLRIIGSTVSGNRSAGFGGAITLLSNNSGSDGGRIDIVNSTIAGNTSGLTSGSIRTLTIANGTSSTITLRNSVVSNNFPSNFSADAEVGTATITSQGFNLSNNYDGVVTPLANDRTGDARLGPLALYGGSVPTHPLLAGSLALDSGNSSAGAPLTGARGEPRLFDVLTIANPTGSIGADIGAVEMQAIMVITDADAGVGSLRQAITDANANGIELDDILFAEPFFSSPRTISLATTLPAISSDLAIHGTAADLLTVQRSSAQAFRVFTVVGGLSHAAFSGLTIRGGSADFGGGLSSGSPFSLVESTVANNVSTLGGAGGVHVDGVSAWIQNSTITGNTAEQDGGGVGMFASQDGQRLRISGSTISGNHAKRRGGGTSILSFGGGGVLEVTDSTFAENTTDIEFDAVTSLTIDPGTSATTTLRNTLISAAPGSATMGAIVFTGAGAATIASRGFNLATDAGSGFLNQPSDQLNAAAGLAPLANNGGSTQTHALLVTSDALDGGNSEGLSFLTDQRGTNFARSVDLPEISNTVDGDGTDIGALEAQTLPAPRPDSIFADGFGNL